MTLQEIRYQLILHFCDKDTFTPADIDKVKLDKEFDNQKLELTKAALAEMVEEGLIRALPADTWILSSPMDNFRQELSISIETGLLISSTLETFFKANEIPYEPINPFNIHEGHILTLLHVLSDVISS